MKQVVLYVLFAIVAFGCASTSMLSEEAAFTLETIDKIKTDPVSDEARDLYGIVLTFAAQSDEIDIEISADTCPWLASIDDEKWSSYILGAYIAGNVEYQLRNNVIEDNPQAGCRFVRFVYGEIKRVDPQFSSKVIEELAED